MKKFITLFFVTVMTAAVLIFGACAVSAAQPDDTSPSVQQTAYDDDYYYDDYYYDNYAQAKRPVNWFKIAGSAFLISTIGTVVIVAVIYGGYKFNGRTEPYPYTRKAPLELTGTEDILVDTQIKRERIDRNRR